MKNPQLNHEGEDPLKQTTGLASTLSNCCDLAAKLEAENEMLTKRNAELEELLANSIPRDFFNSNVTYENVVEGLAACESNQRSTIRLFFETYIPGNKHRQFRANINRKVKELDAAEKAESNTFNNYGTYVADGGTQVNNPKPQ